MRSLRGLVAVAAVLFLFLATPALAQSEAPLGVEVVLLSGEIDAGETLTAGVVVTNRSAADQFVIVEGYLAPPEEPIHVPPASRWERFVWELLAKITGDFEILYIPAGEVRAARLALDVHPRMHGRFEVVGTARWPGGLVMDRASVISKITAPPSGGGVLVHGRLYELWECRLLVTDDGHIYEPKGPRAEEMFRTLDLLRPAPDGVTVLGGILPNTLGCFGVELGVDLFRFDREPGSPVGVAWRHLSRGRVGEPYGGPDEEIVRNAVRFKTVVDALSAQVTGRRPNFRREMVAVVTTGGTALTRIRVTRIFEKDGELQVHYVVTRGGPGVPAKMAAEVADVVQLFGQPYHLVALPRFGGPVRFVRHNVSIRLDAVRTGILDVEKSLDLSGALGIHRSSNIGRDLDRAVRERTRLAERALK